jgi:hypothetical protein
MLGMDFRPTLFSAEIIDTEIMEINSPKNLQIKRLLDVAIFMRIKKIYGKEIAIDLICEK